MATTQKKEKKAAPTPCHVRGSSRAWIESFPLQLYIIPRKVILVRQGFKTENLHMWLLKKHIMNFWKVTLINLTPWNKPKKYCIEIHLWASTSIKYLLKFSLCSALWMDSLPIWNGTASTVWSLYGKSMQ
jgi:hypothetical protein